MIAKDYNNIEYEYGNMNMYIFPKTKLQLLMHTFSCTIVYMVYDATQYSKLYNVVSFS